MIEQCESSEKLQVEISANLLIRLLRDRNLVASDLSCLNTSSCKACSRAIKASVLLG